MDIRDSSDRLSCNGCHKELNECQCGMTGCSYCHKYAPDCKCFKSPPAMTAAQWSAATRIAWSNVDRRTPERPRKPSSKNGNVIELQRKVRELTTELNNAMDLVTILKDRLKGDLYVSFDCVVCDQKSYHHMDACGNMCDDCSVRHADEIGASASKVRQAGVMIRNLRNVIEKRKRRLAEETERIEVFKKDWEADEAFVDEATSILIDLSQSSQES